MIKNLKKHVFEKLSLFNIIQSFSGHRMLSKWSKWPICNFIEQRIFKDLKNVFLKCTNKYLYIPSCYKVSLFFWLRCLWWKLYALIDDGSNVPNDKIDDRFTWFRSDIDVGVERYQSNVSDGYFGVFGSERFVDSTFVDVV